MAHVTKSVTIELHGESSLGEIWVAVLKLFVPTFASRLAWIGMKFTDTALIGHSGTDFLTASSLADFWTSIWGVFIQDSILGSLCGQAYGAKNYANVGVWVQVSCVVFGWVLIPVFFLYTVTSPVLQYLLHEPANIAGYGGYYATVLALCLPARLLSGKVSTFFTSQKITEPSSRTTPIALLLNLTLGLQFVLGIPYAGVKFGFWACPVVTTCVEYFITIMIILYYCGKKRLHEKCYPEEQQKFHPIRDIYLAPFSSKDSERFAYFHSTLRPKVWEYIKLAVPSTLALGSDFWRMSLIGLYSGSLGVAEVAVFNSSYRLAWLNLTIIGSFSSACATQLSIALGTGDGKFAYKIRNIGIFAVASFLLFTVGLTLIFIEELAHVFSNDPEVIDLYIDSRYEMACMVFCMCLSIHFESLLYALKRSETVFYSGLAGSWLGQVPAVIGLCHFYGNKLPCVYSGVAFGYALLTILYAGALLRINLDEEAEKAYEANKAVVPLTAFIEH